MNILFLTWKDIKHPAKWWAEIVLMNYMERLVSMWYDITWFSSWFEWWKDQEIINWIKIIRKFSINNIYFNSWRWYKDYKKNNKIDIIIDEAWWIPLLSPLYEKNIPIVFFIHHIWDKEWDYKFKFPMNNIYKFIFKNIIKLYKNKFTITVSDSTKNELINDFWFDKNKTFVIENACDIIPIEDVNFDIKDDAILFLWRLMPIKRVEDAIKAFYFFDKKKNWYKLNIIWNDQDKDYVSVLKNLIKSLDIEDKVIFKWQIPRENFQSEISKNKLLLVPSYKEWFWLVVLEWNSYWLPAIWYDVPWLRDSIKEWINWSLIKDWDHEQMWEKIFHILDDQRLYKKLSLSSLNHVKSLDWWDHKTKQFDEIIKLIWKNDK
jgi:glycosyltransferase involved in cell wall biosynthesis